MSDPALWLLNWETKAAFYLGTPAEWTTQTASILQAQVIGNTLNAEVVWEGTPWFRVLAGQIQWTGVVCELPEIKYESEAEKQVALACLQRSRRERLHALCEAYLRVDTAVNGALPEPEWSGTNATV